MAHKFFNFSLYILVFVWSIQAKTNSFYNINEEILFESLSSNTTSIKNRVTHGPEFEFSSKRLLKLWDDRANYKPHPSNNGSFWLGAELEEAKAMAEIAKSKCGKSCKMRIEEYKSVESYVFEFSDGYWFRISTDPLVVEVQMAPLTLAQLKKYKKRIQKFIFDSATEAKLYPHYDFLAGHYNFGLFSAFGSHFDSMLSFFSFYFDSENFAELWLGGLGGPIPSANPISVESQSIINKLIRLNDKLQSSLLFDPPQSLLESNLDFLIHLEELNLIQAQSRKNNNSTIDNKSYRKQKYLKPLLALNIHDRAVNIEKVLHLYETYMNLIKRSQEDPNSQVSEDIQELFNDVPVEMRATRAQKNIDEFILLSELFALRMEFLLKKNEGVYYLGRSLRNPSPSQIVDMFYLYVTEADGDYEKFKYLLPKRLQRIQPHTFLKDQSNPPKNEKEFLRIKKYIPYILNSHFIYEKFLGLYSNEIPLKSLPWMAALLKEMLNYNQFLLKNASHASAVFYSKFREIFYTAATKNQKILPYLVKRRESFKNEVLIFEEFLKSYNDQFINCEGFFSEN